MPLSYRIDKSLGVVFITAEGVVTAQELSDHQQEVLQDPDFNPSFNLLLDFTEVTSLDVSADEWRSVFRTKLFREYSRRAILIQDSQYHFGMFRMGQLVRDAGPNQFQIFHDMKEARKWLGLE